MRAIKFKDVFKFSEIIDKMGLKTDINRLTEESKGKGEEAQAYMGGQLILLLLSKAHLASFEICDFFAGLTSKTVEEIEDLDFTEMKELFKELFEKNDVLSFFNSATVEKK